MKIFDGHLHTFRFNLPVREGINLFKRQFDRFNIEKMIYLALPCDVTPGKVGFEDTDLSDNMKVMYYKSVFSPNAYAYAGLEYKGIDRKDKKVVANHLLEQVKKYKEVGFDGMKMYEGHPNHRRELGYPLDDEVFDLYFDYCEKERIPVIMHLANPEYMWDANKVSDYWKARGCFFDETYPSFNQLHEEILSRLDKNPNLIFFLAHWGFLTYNKKTMDRYMSFKNTYLDVCPGGENFFNMMEDKEYWKPFIEKYSNRITYGTDTYDFEYDNEENWYRATGARPLLVQNFFTKNVDEHYKYYEDDCTGIGASKETIQKVFYDNLNNLLGKPKKIDYDYFIDRCEKLYETAPNGTMYRYNLYCMKNDFKSMKNGSYTFYKK